VLAWRLFRPDDRRPAAGRPEDRSLLVEDVHSVAFAYFGSRTDDAPPDWYDEWNDEYGLPELVRLRVDFETGQTARWPELIVAPRITGRSR